jgi:hypothetical protein
MPRPLFSGRLPRAAAPLPPLAAPTKHVPRRNPRTYSHSLSVHRHSICGAQSSERYSLPLITLSVGNSGVPHAWPWFLEAMCEPAKPHGHSIVLPHGNHLHWESPARINNRLARPTRCGCPWQERTGACMHGFRPSPALPPCLVGRESNDARTLLLFLDSTSRPSSRMKSYRYRYRGSSGRHFYRDSQSLRFCSSPGLSCRLLSDPLNLTAA